MGRRDRDERPPVQIVGASQDLSSTQQVAIGPGARRPGRGRSLAIGVTVVTLLGGGLLLGGQDDAADGGAGGEGDGSTETSREEDRTSTTRRRTTTTRPTTTTTAFTIAAGPIFGEPIGGWLLIKDGVEWTVVDVDSGTRRIIELPVGDAYQVFPLPGGFVVQDGRSVLLVDIDGGSAEPEMLDDADQVVAAGRTGLWLIDTGGFYEGDIGADSAVVRLVDHEGEVIRSFQIPAGYVSAGVEDGVVIDRGGRLYLFNERGPQPLAVGYALAAFGNEIVVESCDDDALCNVEIRSLDGGPAVELVPRGDGIGTAAWAGPDGQIAISSDGETTQFFGADGSYLGAFSESPLNEYAGPAWLPGDHGLLVTDGVTPSWIHLSNDEVWLSDSLPGLQRLRALLVVYVPPRS